MTKVRTKPMKIPKAPRSSSSYTTKVGPVKNPVTQYDSLINLGNKDVFAFIKAIFSMVKF